jgi:hypothetical protein
LPNIDKPYKRFTFSGIVTAIFFLSFVFYIIMNPSAKVFGIAFENNSSLLGFVISLIPFSLIFRYFIVRLICVLKMDLPLRLVSFLDEMNVRHLFESDGGSWRFRHRILQDYFVQKYISSK